jgi:hypothetical protein
MLNAASTTTIGKATKIERLLLKEDSRDDERREVIDVQREVFIAASRCSCCYPGRGRVLAAA